jgi:serine/threonine protein kinase
MTEEPELGAAHHLVGLDLDDGWHILAKVDLPETHTGSAFSVGYLVSHAASGSMGYLKAFDYSEALADLDPARALAHLTATYNAERDLLELCRQHSLHRIVRALAAGTVRLESFRLDVVSYLIFELADSDARDLRAETDPADHVPILRIAHHAAVAISQLHGIGASHQDLKPSNLLVWHTLAGPEGKLGDLGCAHLEGRPAPHDDRTIAGDCSYAAPEQLYSAQDVLSPKERRRAADVYMLGNLLMFLLTSISHSGLLYLYVDSSQHWRRGGGTFEEVLPALVDCHGKVLSRVSEALHSDIRETALKLINELCYPDPRYRGDPVAGRYGQDRFGLHRYITRLDLLYHRAAIAGGVRA